MSNYIKSKKINYLIVVALIFALIGCYFLIQPYVNSIVMGFIISLLIYPMHQWIESRWFKNRNAAAFVSCTILVFIIIFPLFFVVTTIIKQGLIFSQNLYHWVSDGGVQVLLTHPTIQKTLTFLNHYLPFDEITPQEIAQKVGAFATDLGQKIVGKGAQMLGDATSIIFGFLMTLFVLFFLLRDHDKMIQTLRHVLPFSRRQEDKLLTEIENVSKSAVTGSFLTAIAQGIAGGIGMGISGFPAFFWGTMLAFASFIPMVGTALIWIPACLYLLLTGELYLALFLFIWSLAIVGSIDNFLRPFLMQGSTGMSSIMIFFSLLGGLHLFGLIGLIYGPIIFALTAVLFTMYEEEFKDFLDSQDNS